VSETDNPPYDPPYGLSDAPPPVPSDPNMAPETQAYLDGFVAPPDPRDPVEGGAARNPEDYQDAFVKPPDPRDPENSILTPEELKPPSTPEGETPDASPPVNVDVPMVSQDAAALNCTMGNWDGEPDAYAYQWLRDGVEVGDGTAVHPVTEADIGVDFACVVTASNAAGSTVAPVSNTVTAAGAARDAGHRGRRHKNEDKSEDPF
jgi:hypothetical protein